MIDTNDDTYVGPATSLSHNRTHEWNHGIGGILAGVPNAGLVVRCYEEHREIDWRPWGCLKPPPRVPAMRRPAPYGSAFR